MSPHSFKRIRPVVFEKKLKLAKTQDFLWEKNEEEKNKNQKIILAQSRL